MRSAYDFSRGQRGKFHRVGARLRVPVYLDVSIHAQLFQRALARSMTADDLATELLREDLKVRPMSIEGNRAKGFSRAPKRIEVSVGESVRIIREMQGLSQNQLAAAAGVPQARISSVERGRVTLGVEHAKVLARALDVHPAVLVFPGWAVHVAVDEQLRSPRTWP